CARNWDGGAWFAYW
nr:immunoglobulin heavy chain junction region [Mus musculus]